MYSMLFILFAATAAYAVKTGGVREMTRDEISKDKTLQAGLDKAVESYNVDQQKKLGRYRMVAEEIQNASTQVVAGIMYRVVVKMVVTNCENTPENANKKIEECSPRDNAYRRFCTFRILSQPWVEEKLRVVRTDCTIDK